MQVKKQVIGTLEKCYAVTKFDYDGEKHLVCAAEKNGPAWVFDTKGNRVETLWDGPGGVMTMTQWPVKNEGKILLATQKFYSPNDSADASIVYYTCEHGTWQCHTLCRLPFVHRFGILESDGAYYLVACTLKSAHAFKNDWTCPGRIWTARFDRDIRSYSAEAPIVLTPLKSGLLQNHGFEICSENGHSFVVVGTANGVIRVTPPGQACGDWLCETLLDKPVSDMLYLDLDGDGERELLTISPFHGDTLTLYKKENGAYRESFVWPQKMPFLHAIWGEKIGEKWYAFLGNREGERELLAIHYDRSKAEYVTEIIDRGAGTANCMAFCEEGKYRLFAANRESSEVALYTLQF